MGIRYGLNVRTPTNRPTDNPWAPVLATKDRRLSFNNPESLVNYIDAMKRANGTIELQVVEIVDDDPTYSV